MHPWQLMCLFAAVGAREMNRRHWIGKAHALLPVPALLGAILTPLAIDGQPHEGSAVCSSALLTTTRQVHSMTYQQASSACRVDLRGVVVYFDPYREGGNSIFLSDISGTVLFVLGPPGINLPLHPGSHVEVTGVTNPGGFSPSVNADEVRVLGPDCSLPVPHRATLSSLEMDKEDGQWVEIEGVVHAVGSDGMRVVLTLGTDEGSITASTLRESNAEYSGLIGSRVLIRGRPNPLVDRMNRRMVGVRLLFPNFKAVTVEKPAPPDPYALPLERIGSLMQFSPGKPFQQRIHIRGQVTLDWPGRMLCLEDGKAALCVETADRGSFKIGQLVDAVGFSAWDHYQFTLTDAMLRPGGYGTAPLPVKISADEAFSGSQNGDLVQIEGQLIGKSRAASGSTLLLATDKLVFPAILPGGSDVKGLEKTSPWADGSKLRVTGIFAGRVDERQITRDQGTSRIESFQILLRSPADVAVLESPPWWTSRRLLMLLTVLVILAVAILTWNAALRLRVEQQTRRIRLSEARFRHLAQHDALTGLAVRSVLIDRLEAAIQEANLERSSFALLMMDVDRFKKVNDALGHSAGDEMLRAAASRIRDSVRKTDTVARMGGDEFMALLPGISGSHDAQRIAAQVVANVSAPVLVAGREAPLSVSVGLTIFPEGGADAASLMHNADVAMYRAKGEGGNCYKCFVPLVAPENMSREPSAHQAAHEHALDIN
jgi:diguanylate cyclase (GGDEF)-like protein